MSDSLRPHESQHARPPCPSPTPGVHLDSRPPSQWCHPAISSSVVPFSSCPQSLPFRQGCGPSVIRLTSFLWVWFQCVCPLMPSSNTYCLTWVSLTLSVGYLFRLLQQSAAIAPYLGRGVSPYCSPSWPSTWDSSSRPSCACAATAPWTWGWSSRPPPLASGLGAWGSSSGPPPLASGLVVYTLVTF